MASDQYVSLMNLCKCRPEWAAGLITELAAERDRLIEGLGQMAIQRDEARRLAVRMSDWSLARHIVPTDTIEQVEAYREALS